MYQIYFILEMTLYVFRTVFASIIRISRLLASRKQYLFDKCLLLYVQS